MADFVPPKPTASALERLLLVPAFLSPVVPLFCLLSFCSWLLLSPTSFSILPSSYLPRLLFVVPLSTDRCRLPITIQSGMASGDASASNVDALLAADEQVLMVLSGHVDGEQAASVCLALVQHRCVVHWGL